LAEHPLLIELYAIYDINPIFGLG